MQKKLIALAIASALTAPALAFADASVYGLVDGAVANISSDGHKSDMLAISGGLSTSRIGVKASEDVGNGMKGIINLEYKLDTENSDSILVARQEMVALSGGFGTVATGYLQTTGLDFGVKFDPLGGSSISPLGNIVAGGKFLIGAVGGAARASRALAYISPDFNGLSFAVNHSTALADAMGNTGLASGATTSLKTTATLLSADYKAGPAAVGLVYAKTSNDSVPAVPTNTETALGGSFDFGVAKAFATYQSDTPTGGSASKAMSVGGTIPVGPGAVVVSYAKATMAGINTSGSGETVGYLYDMSKTMTFYGAYSAMSNSSATTAFGVANSAFKPATAGGKSSIIAVGLRKKF